jgi:hypothetical protein
VIVAADDLREGRVLEQESLLLHLLDDRSPPGAATLHRGDLLEGQGIADARPLLRERHHGLGVVQGVRDVLTAGRHRLVRAGRRRRMRQLRRRGRRSDQEHQRRQRRCMLGHVLASPERRNTGTPSALTPG